MEGGQNTQLNGERVRIRGAVQGVGFRPTVFRVAHEMNLAGWVLNDSDGVLIHLEEPIAATFVRRLNKQLPDLARIDRIEYTPARRENLSDFSIRESTADTRANTCITADAATCDACLDDILDPYNRRYGYAFTNCTHCGPRYSITRRVPYDRANTSMADFAFCPDCEAEYHNPYDRRFHAQPNACPTCGPVLSHDIRDIADVIQKGGCVAVKGLGGFQLLADARNAAAVAKMREIKKRDAKPFAVMVAGLASALQLGAADDLECQLLMDHRRPIVIVPAAPQPLAARPLADGVTLGLKSIGLMLPTTALHYLIFHFLAGRPTDSTWLADPLGPALVCTSANIAGAPIISDNDIAQQVFSDVADLVVTHNRDIVTPIDDSVARVFDGAPMLIRRARGYAPDPIDLNVPIANQSQCADIIALGAELKNTICITRGNEAFMSPHIGNQRGQLNQQLQRHVSNHMLAALDVSPVAVVTDLHPDMNAHSLTLHCDKQLLRVQHHQAHIASVLAENKQTGQTLGLALDGYGMASDGVSAWGGELISVDGCELQHHASLSPLDQPGGDAAAAAPWRMAISLLQQIGVDPKPYYQDMDGFDLVSAMLAKNLNCPKTSSAGRLFDAISSLAGLCHINAYEGEAAMRLEDAVTQPEIVPGGWEIMESGNLSMHPLIPHLLGRDATDIANLFHGSFAAALADWIFEHAPTPQVVALSGGCFQNKVLATLLANHLRASGYQPLFNRQVPSNDGGISLGQAYVAMHQIQKNWKKSCA